MKPIHRMLGLVPLVYGVLTLVTVAVSFLLGTTILQTLPFTAAGFMLLGAFLLFGGGNAYDEFYDEKVTVSSRGALEPRMYAHLQPRAPAEEGTISTPSGMRPEDHVDAARWLRASNVGLAAIVAGAAMMISAYLIGFR